MRYEISQKGVDDLNTLANEMATANADIEQAGKTLGSSVTAVQDGLGIYSGLILSMLAAVNKDEQQCRDAVCELTQKITQMANDITVLISWH